MQLVILLYHITGASTVLPIYMHIRVLVAAYVFLNGYGNFFFCWLKGDTSIMRYIQVRLVLRPIHNSKPIVKCVRSIAILKVSLKEFCELVCLSTLTNVIYYRSSSA